MYVRGNGVEFVTVTDAVERVSAELFGGRFVDGEVMVSGNVITHPDASPIGTVTRVPVAGVPGAMRDNGYGFRGRIIGERSGLPGTRVSASGRRGPWACWHAYGEVMLAVFRIYPHATITSAQARYAGMAGFLSTFPRTADANVGSLAFPVAYADLCDCTHDELSVSAADYRMGGQ